MSDHSVEVTIKRAASVFRGSTLLLAVGLAPLLWAQDPWECAATVKIDGGLARRGTEVVLPLVINGNCYLMGLSFSLDFDEEVLEAVGFERLYRRPDGMDWRLAVLRFDNQNAVPGNGGLEEGYLVGGIIFYLGEEDRHMVLADLPPPDADNPILGLRFRVKQEAPLGPTEIRFQDGAIIHPNSPPVRNVVTLNNRWHGPESADLTFQVAPLQVHGLLGIVDDISLFVRGDSNDDLRVNLSDAVTTLGYLFLGGGNPPCLDAADANDDGRIDIVDPVATLSALFLGSQPLPPPRGSPGVDPTPEDPFDC